MSKPVRLSLDLSPELNETLENLAAATYCTKSEVMRKAIALIEVAVRARTQGKKLAVVDRDQPVATEIIGL